MANETNFDLFGEPVIEEAVTERDVDGDKLHKHELYDFVRSVKETKVDLRKESITVTRGKGDNKKILTIQPDPTLKNLDMFMLLKALSQNVNLAPIAQMMNKMSHLPKDMQYVFLLTAIPANKSFDKWINKTVGKLTKQLIEVCLMSERDANEFVYVFTEEQVNAHITTHKEKNKCKSKKSKKL